MSKVTKRAIYSTNRGKSISRRTRNNFKLKLEKAPTNYPSRFGSHSTMQEGLPFEEVVATHIFGEDKVLMVNCKDEFGTYKTEYNRLDSGVADPNRFETSRLSKLFHKEKEK